MSEVSSTKKFTGSVTPWRTSLKDVLEASWLAPFALPATSQGKPPPIVAENALDATSKLAMAPSDSQGRPAVPDFVNALAIKARALCQVLAYPEMSVVLRDLFSKAKGSPLMMMVSADVYALGGQTLTFRAVVKRVLRAQPPAGQADDVCLGLRTADGILRMPPLLSERHTFGDKDKIIIVTRKAPTSEVYESMVGGHGGQADSQHPTHRFVTETPLMPYSP